MSFFSNPCATHFHLRNKSAIMGIALLGLASGLFADAFDKAQPKGLLAPTAEDIAWSNTKFVHVTSVIPNQRALDLTNEMLKKKNQPTISASSVTIAPMGQDVSSVPRGTQKLAAQSALTADPTTILPDAVDNSTASYFPPIRQQIGNTCVPNAVVYYALGYMTGLARGWTSPQQLFSPRFSYNFVNTNDGGTIIEKVMRISLENGAPSLTEWPDDASNNFLKWPTNSVIYRSAMDYRVDQLGDLTISPEFDVRGIVNAKQMLANGYVLIVGSQSFNASYIPISNDPSTSADDIHVGQLIAHANSLGSQAHALTIVGYNDNLWADLNNNGVVNNGEKGAFKIANSWGVSYGNSGFAWISYDALNKASMVPGAIGVTSRIPIFDQKAFWLTARSQYRPRAYAQITMTHAKRIQQSLSIGVSVPTNTTASATLAPLIFSNIGSNYSYNGTTSPVEATFAIDYTDLIESSFITNLQNWKWYLTVGDISNDATALSVSNMTFVDEQAGTTFNNFPGVPFTLSGTSRTSILTTQLKSPVYNNPPIINMPVSPVYLTTGLVARLGTTITDDGLPYGIPVASKWVKKSGPGTVLFEKASTVTTNFIFSEPGTYVVSCIADDSELKTVKDLTISVMNTIGSIPSPSAISNILINGNYAYCSLDYQLVTMDITNKSNPIIASTVDGLCGSSVKVGSYLYSFYSSQITVFDISDPSTPLALLEETPVTSSTGFLATDNTYLYLASGDQLFIYSLASPTMPDLMGSLTYTSVPGILASPAAKSISLQGSTVAVSYYGQFALFNVANKSAPSLLSQVPMGTLTTLTEAVLYGNNVYLGTANGLQIWDISNPSSPAKKYASSYFNVTESVDKLVISGNLAYITNHSTIAPYLANFVVLDITDRIAPVTIASCAIPSSGTSVVPVTVAGQYVYSGQDGLYLFNSAYTTRRASVSPVSVSFGSMPLGTSATRSIMLVNNGNAPTTVQSITIDNKVFSQDKIAPVSIPANGSTLLTGTFAPNALNTFSGTMKVASNAMDFPLISVPLSGSCSNSLITLDRTLWKASANIQTVNAQLGIDGNVSSSWSTLRNQASGDWFMIDLGSAKTFDSLIMDNQSNSTTYPRTYRVDVSADKITWTTVKSSVAGVAGISKTGFASQNKRYIRVWLTAGASAYWTINEFSLVNWASNKIPTIVTAATATPTTVTGKTTALKVLASDDGGESELTYSWFIETPTSIVTYSPNNSNTAKNTTVTFDKAGTYICEVFIEDKFDQSTGSQVTVTVKQTQTTFAVTPKVMTVNPGKTQQFYAAFDQFGNQMSPQPTTTWTVTAGGGTISSTGLYTAGNTAGTYTIKAVSGAKSSTTTVIVSTNVPSHTIRIKNVNVGTGIDKLQYFNGISWISVNADNASLVYTGTWVSDICTDAIKTSNIPGSTCSFTFAGTGIRWYDNGDCDPNSITSIYLDGIYQTDVSPYFNNASCNTRQYEKLGL